MAVQQLLNEGILGEMNGAGLDADHAQEPREV